MAAGTGLGGTRDARGSGNGTNAGRSASPESAEAGSQRASGRGPEPKLVDFPADLAADEIHPGELFDTGAYRLHVPRVDQGLERSAGDDQVDDHHVPRIGDLVTEQGVHDAVPYLAVGDVLGGVVIRILMAN